MHYRIDDLREDEVLHTTLGYEKQDYDSLETSPGWRLHDESVLGARMCPQPYVSLCWVRELADGRSEGMDSASRDDGRVRVANMGNVNKDSGRAQLDAQLVITERLRAFTEANSRLVHNGGNQAGYSFGANR